MWVWVQAYQRSQQMPLYGHQLLNIQPPVNRQLQDSSSWINMAVGADSKVPDGWIRVSDVPVIPSTAKREVRESWTTTSERAGV